MASQPASKTQTTNRSRLTQKVRKRDRSEPEMKGWLLKWTNYVKGYQRRWFVLSRGVLSYYLETSEVNQAARGTIALKGALIEHLDELTFVISHANNESFRIKASNETELKAWLTTLELARSQASIPAASRQQSQTIRRRTRVPDKPNYPLNLWALMKNCIGKDLSKIPMPVNFNEPISMLQRLVEDYEYSEILNNAAACTDPCEQLAYLAAFTVSAYGMATKRISKPFNPLLGETYECDRMDDLGWRCLTEQVSHHPPITALHCESKDWQSWQEFSMSSKFRGKYLQVNPIGAAHVLFPKSGNCYTYRRVTTTVNNIIVGKLWVDLEGELEIVGSKAASGYKCILNYIPYSYFGREAERSVKGLVLDRNNEAKWLVRGTWDDKIEMAPVLQTTGTPKNPSYTTGEYKLAWQCRAAPAESEKYYNFSTFACQLNEPEEGVAPTDSRLRPDQRLMEQGDWDASNQEKLRLEEKQRAVRRQREAEEKQATAEGRSYPEYAPRWFRRERVEGSEDLVHLYNNSYWQAKAKKAWNDCPDIY